MGAPVCIISSRRDREADSGEGVVLLTDMFGGTPSNLAIGNGWRKGGGARGGLANLPMLIKLASVRDTQPLE